MTRTESCLCIHSLKSSTIKGLTVEACVECGGVWVSPTEFNHFLAKAKSNFPHGDFPFSLNTVNLRDENNPKECHVDNTPLQRFDFMGVEIDICPCCGGVWFDSGELEESLVKRQKMGRVIPKSSSKTTSDEPVSDLAEAALDIIGDLFCGIFDGL